MEKDIPKNSLAYDYYLRSFSYPLTIDGSSDAIRMLEKSIQLDSTYAPAHVELGYHISRLAQHAYNKSSDIRISEQYFLNALKINSELIDALVQLAGLYVDIGKTDIAYDLALQALRINPNNAWVRYRLSYIYRYTGMLEESAKEVEKTLSIDNQNPRFGAMQLTYFFLGNYRKVIEISKYYKENVFTKQRLGQVYYILGEIDSAITYCNRALEDDPNSMPGTLAWVLKAYIKNDPEEGFRVLKRWEKTDPHDSEVIFFIARLYCLLNYKDDGIRLLKKAIESGFYCYPFFPIDPFLDPVRDDPEFQKVLALAKQKHEEFKQKVFFSD
jgi:tetratricopeptide (TPR) repeat protein